MFSSSISKSDSKTPIHNQRTPRRITLAIFFCGLVLGLTWNFCIPPGEGPDEMAHFRTARWWWTNHSPPPPELVKSGVLPEGFQPPIYYIIVGGIISGLDGWEVGDNLQDNPDFGSNNTLRAAAIYQHHPRLLTDFIHNAKFHIIRGLSALVLAFSGVFLFLGLRRLSPENPKLAIILTVGWLALPVVSFSGSVINNDSLAMFLGTLLFWLTVRYCSARISWKAAAVLGAIAGIAAWVKFSALFGLIFLVISIWLLSKHTSGRIRDTLVAVITGLAVSSPILLYNLVYYGSPGGYHGSAATMGGGGFAAILYHVGRSIIRTAESFVGRVGQMNVSAPGYAALLFGLFLIVIIMGLIAGQQRKTNRILSGFVWAAVLTVGAQMIAGFAWFVGTVSTMTARLLLNLAGPLATIGLVGLLPFQFNDWSLRRLKFIVWGSALLVLIALIAFFAAPHSIPFLTSKAYGSGNPAYSIAYYVQQSRQALLGVIVILMGMGFIALWLRRTTKRINVMKFKPGWFWACICGLILSNQVILWVFVVPTYYPSF